MILRRILVVGTASVMAIAGGGGLASASQPTAARSSSGIPTSWDWPTYGQNAEHTFSTKTTLTQSSVKTLAQRWFFPTGTAVTATPTIVDGTVYVGSWDRFFYAVNMTTGKLEWRFRAKNQPGVTPYPGETPRNIGSDGGLITSSAWYEPGSGGRPALVIFGAGYTLYALNAQTGKKFWSHAYTGNPTRPPRPTTDNARIFSSPVVSGGRVLFGLSVDGTKDERGYVVAATLATGIPVWEYQSDRNGKGKIPNDGCGNVWTSGTLLPAQGWVVFGAADCNFADPPPTADSVFALRISDGSLVWRYRPSHPATLQCDWDFGATVNVGLGKKTRPTFLGVGSKDGTYYSLDPLTGHLRWKSNVVFGGFSGGFIATAAFDGTTVYGATALGDFGRFESNGSHFCDPSDPRDVQNQQPSLDTFDAHTGTVGWQQDNANSFGPTTVAGGLVFNSMGLASAVTVRSAATGVTLDRLPLLADCWGGIAVVGDAVVFGTGTSTQGNPDGVALYTPSGIAPDHL